MAYTHSHRSTHSCGHCSLWWPLLTLSHPLLACHFIGMHHHRVVSKPLQGLLWSPEVLSQPVLAHIPPLQGLSFCHTLTSSIGILTTFMALSQPPWALSWHLPASTCTFDVINTISGLYQPSHSLDKYSHMPITSYLNAWTRPLMDFTSTLIASTSNLTAS